MKDYLVLIGTRGASALAQMCLVFLLAASSNSADFGLVMAVFAALSVIAAVADLGLGPYALRAAARSEVNAAAAAVRLSTRLCVVVGLGASLSLLIAGFSEPLYFALSPLCIWALAERNTETRNYLQLALGDVRRVGVLVGARRVASVPIMLLLSPGTTPAFSFSFALCSSSLLAWIVSIFWTRKWTTGIRTAPLRLLWEQRALAVSGISSQIRNLDTTLVGVFASAAAAGIYGLGVRVGAPLLIVHNAASNLLMARAHHADRAGARRTQVIVVWGLSLLVAGSAPLLTPLAAPPLLEIIHWLNAEDLVTLGVLISMTSFVGLGVVLDGVLVSADKDRFVAVNSLMWALTSLALVVVFAATAGPLAASIAATAGYMAKCVVLQVRITTINHMLD